MAGPEEVSVRQAWLIYNPAAGRFPAGPLLDRAVRVLTEAGWEILIVRSQPGQSLAEPAAKAVQAGCEAVFVAGGDGSVGQAASALAGTPVALGVLPSGTANVWAGEIGLPRLDWVHWFALEEAAAQLARGTVRLVDIGEVNGKGFLLWAGVGLDAQIVGTIEPRERWEKTFGVLQYGIWAAWNARGWTGVDLRVSSGGEVWEDRFVVAVASNIRSYAGGLLELAPWARLDDGLLDFWLINGRSMRDAVIRAVQVLMGAHVDAPGVVHFQASEAIFEAQGELPMHLDGEPSSLLSPVRIVARKQSLRVIVPEGGISLLARPTEEHHQHS